MKVIKKVIETVKRPEVFTPITMAIMGSLILKLGKTQGAIDMLNELKKECKNADTCQNCAKNKEENA